MGIIIGIAAVFILFGLFMAIFLGPLQRTLINMENPEGIEGIRGMR
ncbi:hypothetical protein [Halobacillus sp. BBL2006]|nr:hypothetical protein [Halobacillus sp. BBL2006]